MPVPLVPVIAPGKLCGLHLKHHLFVSVNFPSVKVGPMLERMFRLPGWKQSIAHQAC